MRNMMNLTSERQASRMQADREELADRIARALPRDGKLEPQPGLFLYRMSAPTEPVYGVSESSLCVIAQGSKHVLLGEDRFRYDPVTAMSPLQFQKQLRLQEARRLMLSEDLDAAEAGYRVGYDDPSHFSREYKRHFGEPPVRDVERLRELATA
jgi:hypothetical protein